VVKKQIVKKPRGSSDPALSAFKALQHVIDTTEGKPKVAGKPPKKRQTT